MRRDEFGRRRRLALVFLATAALTACGRATGSPSLTAAPLPTVAPVFGSQSTVTVPTPLPPLINPSGTELPAVTSVPETATSVVATPDPTSSSDLQPITPVQVDIQIYDDKLTAGWTLRYSNSMKYNERSTSFVYSGTAAVLAQPTKAFGQLIFAVAKDGPQIYRRDRVLGVRFRVSSDAAIIPNDGLIVTVYGSKDYTYFVPNDTSATRPEGRVTTDEPLFPETRLYFLDVNRDIEKGEWAEVVVMLDEHFTPDYTYVTALSIKNDEGFMDPFTIDDVALITITS